MGVIRFYFGDGKFAIDELVKDVFFRQGLHVYVFVRSWAFEGRGCVFAGC